MSKRKYKSNLNEESDEEVWNFKSLTKKKTVHIQRKLGTNSPIKFKSSRENNYGVQCKDAKQPITLMREFCPMCQMPYSALTVQTPERHTFTCLEHFTEPMEECDIGISCVSVIPNHYQQYSHKLLANNRAGINPSDGSNTSIPTNDSKDILECVTHNEDTGTTHCHTMNDNRSEHVAGLAGLADLAGHEKSTNAEHNDEHNAEHSDENNDEHSPKNERTQTVNNLLVRKQPDKSQRMVLTVQRKEQTGSFCLNDVTKQQVISELSVTKKQSSLDSFLGLTTKKSENLKQNAQSKQKWNVFDKMRQSFNIKEHKNTLQRTKSDTTTIASTSTNNSTSTSTSTSNWKSPVSESSSWGNKKRECPFYKKIPGTTFSVDAFSYGVIPGITAYFLSHFHADHYMGLRKSFKQPIYCSQITANLVRKRLYVEECYLHRLPMNQECSIDGVKVTLLEANHCPGAVLFLFEMRSGINHLHTGDFRAAPTMECAPLSNIKIQQLYLDTTYCDPSYSFPMQQNVIDHAVNLSVKKMAKEPSTLIVVGSYTIGKERVFTGIAETLQCKIYVTAEKRSVLMCLEDARLSDMLAKSPEAARVHVVPMGKLRYPFLNEYLQSMSDTFTSILAFEPTGWTHKSASTSLETLKPKIDSRNITLYGIPYSEHSSYTELRRFVRFIQPTKIIPTVNMGNKQKRIEMQRMFNLWMTEKDTPEKKQLKIHF